MSRQQHPAIDAVADLIRVRPDTIDTDDGPLRVTRPCLLTMLTTYLIHASKNGGKGSGGATVPLDTAAWDLLAEIRHDTYAWADLLGINPQPYALEVANRPGKPSTPPIGRLLRAVTHEAVRVGRDQVADTINRLARSWARQIEEMLAGEPEQRHVRGATCPVCLADSVHELRDDPGNRRRDDGRGTFATPAIVLVDGQDGDPPTLVCLACGWWSPLGLALVDTPDDHQVDDQPGQAA